MQFCPYNPSMVSGEDIAALEAKRGRLLGELTSVSKEIIAARKQKLADEKAVREARLTRIAGMMETMTIAEIAGWEGLSTSRTHVLINEVKRRARAQGTSMKVMSEKP